MSGWHLPDTLPVVAALEALPGVGAVLTLADGEKVTVGAEDCPMLTPPSPEDVGLLLNWRAGPDGSTLYRVPARLAGCAAWALGCRARTTPRLTAVHPSPDAVTFTASQGAGTYDRLTVPRGACVRLGRPVPYAAGQPLEIIVSESGDSPTRIFFFTVYPDTPEGAACLEALGVGLPDGEGEAL